MGGVETRSEVSAHTTSFGLCIHRYVHVLHSAIRLRVPLRCKASKDPFVGKRKNTCLTVIKLFLSLVAFNLSIKEYYYTNLVYSFSLVNCRISM